MAVKWIAFLALLSAYTICFLVFAFVPYLRADNDMAKSMASLLVVGGAFIGVVFFGIFALLNWLL